MEKPNKESENKAIGNDLLLLAELLISEGICNDASSLNTAGNNCSKLPDEAPWSYKLGQLDFLIDEVGSTIPNDATDLKLRFSMSIKSNISEVESIKDPLDSLNFDIEIFGAYINNQSTDIVNLYCSWHLDRHISKAGDGQNKYSHPLYHFTFGGNKMEEQKLDYGSALIIPSPRIAYPPMDAVLGVDFILQNYFSKNKIKTLLQKPEYIEIIKKSQERLWQPYFTSISSKWGAVSGNSFHKEFTYKNLWPFLQ